MMIRIGIILLVVGLTGCIGGGAAGPHVRQYVLEYPPPSVGKISGTEALLKVERFSVARVNAGRAMLYRQGPFRQDAYRDRVWRAAPADMVTDFLQRDLMRSGLFRAVLAARDPEDARFVLTGWLDEFDEVDDGERRKAVLAATVTLLDRSVRAIPGRVVFQKNYRCEAPFAQGGDADLAEAMSRAMSQFSSQVITDIASALKQR